MTEQEVLAAIESKYGQGLEGYPSATTAPDLTGKRYVTIAASGLKAEGEPVEGVTASGDLAAAATTFLDAVDRYAADRPLNSRLVWRKKPEIRRDHGGVYFLARFCFE